MASVLLLVTCFACLWLYSHDWAHDSFRRSERHLIVLVDDCNEPLFAVEVNADEIGPFTFLGLLKEDKPDRQTAFYRYREGRYPQQRRWRVEQTMAAPIWEEFGSRMHRVQSLW